MNLVFTNLLSQTMNSPRFMPPNSSPISPDSLKPLNPPPTSLHFRRNSKTLSTDSHFLRVSCRLSLRSQELRNSNSTSSSNSRSRVFSLRLQRLISEFRSLPEPIDRVKRLLGYASALTQLGGSTRDPDNRVAGCAAQVWLEVEMDELGRVRFGADSDSEITKGFCSCLVYLLDGASPQEVLMVKAEDLIDMNVGLPVRSRVNSWNNVLVGMQERTRALMVKRKEVSSLEPLPSLVISPESIASEEKVSVSG